MGLWNNRSEYQSRAKRNRQIKSSQARSVRKGRAEKRTKVHAGRQPGREDEDDEVSVSLSDRREVKVDE